MNSKESREPISGTQAEACIGRGERSHRSEHPNPPIDYEQRLKAASAILARVALRIADGSAGNPSVRRTEGEARDTATSAPSNATAGPSANQSAMPDIPAEETPPPVGEDLASGLQDMADRAIDEGDDDMEVRAA